MPGLVMAARAGNRMQARQTYRTIHRMERRREFMRGAVSGGGHDDGYDDAPPPQQQQYVAPPPQPAQPSYTDELTKLAELHQQGILTDAEFDAKKKAILGI
jgi:hypothetical protein